MQQMQNTTNQNGVDLGVLLLEVTPLIMRTIRTHMRERHTGFLSVPQYRVLAFLHRHAGVTLSEVAEHMGLTLSSTSRLVDGLVTRELVIRQESPTDRRCLTLHVNDAGESLLAEARAHTLTALNKRLESLTSEQQDAIIQSLFVLRDIFHPNDESHASTMKSQENI
jgi:DNA-binding MarR family transcriptional regulator